ncbi:MAG: hypothetical protein WCL71_15930, partial [Deltaproteobacteria bacterium]
KFPQRRFVMVSVRITVDRSISQEEFFCLSVCLSVCAKLLPLETPSETEFDDEVLPSVDPETPTLK